MRRLALAVALAAALLAGCGGDDSGLTFEDPKGTITVERGMEFTFEFSVNASVGLDWEAQPLPGGPKLVEATGTKVDHPDEDREGESGVKRFAFEAGEITGSQTLVFRKLYRGDQEELRTITLEVR